VKCKNCNSKLKKGSLVCEKCGTAVENVDKETNTVNVVEPKKNNKLIFIILGIVFGVVALAVVLYFLVFRNNASKDVSAILKEAKNSILSADNYKMNLKLDASVKYGNLSYAMGLSADMDIDEKNKLAKMDMSMSMMGMSFDFLGYMEQTGNEYIMYVQDPMDPTSWTKDTIDIGELSSEEVNEEQLEKFFEQYINVENVKSDEKGLTKMKFSMSMKEFNNILQNVDMSELTGTDMNIKFNENLVFYIYTDSQNRLSKIVFDFIENMDMNLGEGIELDKFRLEISFSDYNKVSTIVIPEDVKENAISEGEYNYDDDYTYYEPEDYMDEIIYSAESYCLFTDNFNGAEINFANYNNELELDFEAPVSGKLYIDSNCDVTVSENVVIEGKSCTYQDYVATCN